MKKKPLVIIGAITAVIITLIVILYFLSVYQLYQTPYGHFERVGNLNEARTGHKSFLMSDGKVLIVGGKKFRGSYNNPEYSYVNSIEEYDPVKKKFTIILKDNNLEGFDDAIQLENDQILLYNNVGNVTIYDRTLNTIKKLQSVSGLVKGTIFYNKLGDETIVVTGKSASNKQKISLFTFDSKQNKYSHVNDIELIKDSKLLYTATIDNKIILFYKPYNTIEYNFNINKYAVKDFYYDYNYFFDTIVGIEGNKNNVIIMYDKLNKDLSNETAYLIFNLKLMTIKEIPTVWRLYPQTATFIQIDNDEIIYIHASNVNDLINIENNTGTEWKNFPLKNRKPGFIQIDENQMLYTGGFKTGFWPETYKDEDSTFLVQSIKNSYVFYKKQ